MDFKQYRYRLIGRLVLFSLTILIFAILLSQNGDGVLKLLFLIAIGVQGYYLFQSMNKGNREVVSFLQSIKWDDFSHTYPEAPKGSAIQELYTEFNAVIKKFREIRAEKEAQYQYLKTIVQHVGIGIMTFDKHGEIQIVNTAAKSLLGLRNIRNIEDLKVVNGQLTSAVRDLRTGGRDLVKVSRPDEEDVQLAIYAIELSLRGQEFKLISIQNIQSELEEKEMEAWQNLIRVLTHEIMNSVTPISSLARTIETEMEEWLKNGQHINEISNDQIEDFHMALHTIHRRSDNLITFVNDFRNMTRITLPNLSKTCIQELVKHALALLKNDIQEAGISVLEDIPEDLCIQVDPQQIEQVLINIIKNAVQAMAEDDENLERKLWLKAMQRPEGDVHILIRDNGSGIEEEALKKIFIPFYTTKKGGSGIGLSLSKQIMRHHKGNITAKSVINEGTEFSLRFTRQL